MYLNSCQYPALINYLNKGMTILATPCNGVEECLDGSDEFYCWLSDGIAKFFLWFCLCLLIVISLIWICVAGNFAKNNDLLRFIRKKEYFEASSQQKLYGDDLADLKVTIIFIKHQYQMYKC